jgi:RNA polymerase sigma-70 factor (ECF subfamily)
MEITLRSNKSAGKCSQAGFLRRLPKKDSAKKRRFPIRLNKFAYIWGLKLKRLIIHDMNKSPKDKELLEIFRALYKKEAPVLISYAAGFTNADTAEDVVQDIFLKIWNQRSFLLQEDGIRTYLFRAVRHACLDHLKHLDVCTDYASAFRLKLQIEELSFTDDPDFLMEEDVRLPSIHREIEKLPGKCREIFVMAYLEERKTAEIAALLNLSKRTVEAQLYKGLKAIREALLPRQQS